MQLKTPPFFNRRAKRTLKAITIFAATLGLLYLLGIMPHSDKATASLVKAFKKESAHLSSLSIPIPQIKYGFALDTFQVTVDTIENNQFLADILLPHKVNFQSIDQLARNVENVFSVTKLRADKEYTILSRDTAEGADYFIYEPDVYSYVVYDLKNNLDATIVERPVKTTVKEASGIIESSLWVAMLDNGLPIELIDKMEGVLQWSLDFFRVQVGDKFKLIYEENTIDGVFAGVGKIHGAYFKNFDNEFYAIYYENGKFKGYYDEQARPMKSPFLKSPVKYSRISSGYNPRRFHPILKRVRPHYGTDYAAPRGTPILAVANGVVVAASYGKGNGRFVKIKHDKTYSTQYLHMNGFAKGIRSGAHVKQGQTIGYVGSTGLATGPHVCFRFWKNGRQVNHLRLKLPNPTPMPESEKPTYYPIRDKVVAQLDAIPYKAVRIEEVKEKQELSQVLK